MKSILFLCFLSATCLGQDKTYTVADMPFEIDSATKGIVFRGVVQVPDAKADQLYSRARTFIFKSFVNAKEVIQIDDKADGLLAGKGLLSPGLTGIRGAMAAGMNYETPIEIRVKDGRYRYEISNIFILVNRQRISLNEAAKIPTKPLTEKQFSKYTESLRPFTDLIDNLKAAMSKPDPKDF